MSAALVGLPALLVKGPQDCDNGRADRSKTQVHKIFRTASDLQNCFPCMRASHVRLRVDKLRMVGP